MRLFVTGCLGFIGSNFIHYYLKKYPDSEIVNYDKVTYAGNHNNLKNIDETRYTFTQGDICDYEFLRKSLEKHSPAVVISFAAESHVDNSLLSASEFIQTNVAGTEVVLRCVRDLKLPKLIYISTDEVYGSLPNPVEASEETKFDPNSPYSVSKAAGDLFCHSHFITYNTPVIVIRGSNAYGPRQHPEKLIPKSLTNLLRNKPINIYANGTNIREWIFVEDFCAGIDTVMNFGKIGETYNLGSGANNRVTNNIVANLLCKYFNKSPTEHIKYVTDRAGHDFRYALNSLKLQKLGWRPKFTLEEGLRKTIEWYVNNKSWWEPFI